jgi:Predicted hydrolase of the alpha/beta superfamily
MKGTKKLRAFLLLPGLCQILSAQPSQVITPIEESARLLFDIEQYDLAHDGKPYRLYIAQPANNKQKPRPLLYMLDGNGQFPMLVNTIKEVSDSTPLIVAIGYPSLLAYPKERTRDYTVPVAGHEEGGGAEDFYRFITEKVKPFVEATYCVDTTRQILCGHSHGGLFTLYIAFNHTQAFNNYVAGSPAIWWGGGAVIPKRRPLFFHIPHSITITLGEYEENPELDKSRKNLSPEIRKIKEARKSPITHRDLTSMIAEEVPGCRFILFKNKNHGSSVPEFLLEAVHIAGEQFADKYTKRTVNNGKKTGIICIREQ